MIDIDQPIAIGAEPLNCERHVVFELLAALKAHF